MITLLGDRHPAMYIIEHALNQVGTVVQSSLNDKEIDYYLEENLDINLLPIRFKSAFFREKKILTYLTKFKKSQSLTLLQLKTKFQSNFPEMCIDLLEKCKAYKEYADITKPKYINNQITISLSSEKEITKKNIFYYNITIPKDYENFVIKFKNNEKTIVLESFNGKYYCCTYNYDIENSKAIIEEIMNILSSNGTRMNLIDSKLIPQQCYLHRVNKTMPCFSFTGIPEIFNSDIEKVEEFINETNVDATLIYCILSEYIVTTILNYLNKTTFYLRTNVNNWKCMPMQISDVYYKTILDVQGHSSIEFKIDTGMWIESYPVNENFVLTLPSNESSRTKYCIYFNKITKQIYAVPHETEMQNFYLRGTMNNWECTPMERNVFDFTAICSFNKNTGENLFKIDNGKWTESYPTKDISVAKGTYLIHFNLLSKKIKVIDINSNLINVNQECKKFLCEENEKLYHILLSQSTTLDFIDTSLIADLDREI